MLEVYFNQIETKINKQFEKESMEWKGSKIIDSYIREEIEKTDLNTKIKKRLIDEYFEYGPIQNFLEDESIREIMINHKENIWIENENGFKQINDGFLSEKTYQNFISRILEETNEEIHINKPFVDAKWKDFRIHMISAPLNPTGISICFRKHQKQVWPLEKLADLSWTSSKNIDKIRQIIQSRENFILVGPTSTGKTTSINSFLSEIKDERVVIIEDTDELKIPNPLSLKLLTRTHSKTLDQYDQSELIKQALRMRPDRIIIGEIRQKEAKDFLIALSTGHKGCFCSLHAKDAHQALIRLEMLVQMAKTNWSLEMIRRLIFLSLKYIFVLKNEKTKKVLEGVYKIQSLEKFGFLIDKVI